MLDSNLLFRVYLIFKCYIAHIDLSILLWVAVNICGQMFTQRFFVLIED